MAEKRFTINTLDGSIDLRDTGEVMTYEQTVNLLNELYDENEDLKTIIAFIKQMKKCKCKSCPVNDFINKIINGDSDD